MFSAAFLALMVGAPGEAEVDRVLTDALKAWDVPGAAVVVVRGNDVLVLKGYGQKELGRDEPITPDTVFPLASCTKAFTAAAIATLVDERELDWDDPVRKHLPTFRLSDPHADALVSIRDLLTHRTGLASHDLLWYRAPWSVDEQIRRAGLLPLDYPFRSGFRYSSPMYAAAGRAAAARAGVPWEKLVRERLTDPLGMKGVAFTSRDVPVAARATGHHQRVDGTLGVMPPYEMIEVNPAGSMFATPRDLAAWLSFQLSGGKARSGRRLVSERNLIETRLPQNIVRLDETNRRTHPDSTQLGYAMGWLVYDHRGQLVVAHAGLIDGFRVHLAILPDKDLAFAVFANRHETRMNLAVANTLIDLYCGLPGRDWNAYYRKVVADAEAARQEAIAAREKARNRDLAPTLPLDRYAGTFEHPAYGTATVSALDGKLSLAWGGYRGPLDHFDGNRFRIPEGYLKEELAVFMINGGAVTGLDFVGQRFVRKP